MITGLHHVAIGVADLDAAVDFYVAAFGCEVLFRSSIDGNRPDADRVIGIDGVRAEVAMLRFGASHLELWQYRAPTAVDHRSPANGLGYPHIAVNVVDVDAEHQRLTRLGMTFVGPPVDVGYARAVYGTDPFGNLIELLERAAP